MSTRWKAGFTKICRPGTPGTPELGFKNAGGEWQLYRFDAALPNTLRIVDGLGGKSGLGLGGAQSARDAQVAEMPAEPDVTVPLKIGGVTLRCVGSEYIVSNDHYRVTLERQGGVIRYLRSGQHLLIENQDFYGDQAYFVTLLGGSAASMEQGRWYQFHTEWNAGS